MMMKTMMEYADGCVSVSGLLATPAILSLLIRLFWFISNSSRLEQRPVPPSSHPIDKGGRGSLQHEWEEPTHQLHLRRRPVVAFPFKQL